MRYKFTLEPEVSIKSDRSVEMKKLAQLSSVNSKHAKALAEVKRSLRIAIREQTSQSYLLKFALGKHKFSYRVQGKPNAKKIKSIFQMAGDTLRSKRSRFDKTPKAESKQLGKFSYDMVGGVFQQPLRAAVKKLPDNEVIKKDKAPHRMSQHNFVGVEIEFVSPLKSTVISDKLVKLGLASHVTIKQDGSLRPNRAEDHCHEITMLCTQAEVREKLYQLCDLLNGPEVQGYVNERCGLHVHLDMRHRNVNIAYNNLVRCYPILASMVPRSRLNNEYCRRNESVDMNYVTGDGRYRRYQAINNLAYTKFKTLEVRLHHGTLDAARIYNWIQTLINPADLSMPIAKDVVTVSDYVANFKVADDLFLYLTQRVADMKTCVQVDEDTNKYTMVG